MIIKSKVNEFNSPPETVDSFIDSRAFFHGDLSKQMQVQFGTGNLVTTFLDVRTSRGELGRPAMVNPGLDLPTLETGTFNGFDELLFNNFGTLTCDQQMPGGSMSFYFVLRDIAGQITNPDFGTIFRGNSFVGAINGGDVIVQNGFSQARQPGRVDGVYSFTVPAPFNVVGTTRIRFNGDLSGTGSSAWATTSLGALILGFPNGRIRLGEFIAIADLDVEESYIHQFISNHLVSKWFT